MTSMRQLRQKRERCAKMFATECRHTFNLQQVSDGVHGCPSWGESTWYSSMLESRSMAHTTMTWFCLKNDCLECVRSMLYSLPSYNAVLLLLLTERERQSTSLRYQSCFHFTTALAPITAQTWTCLTTKDREKCSSRFTKFTAGDSALFRQALFRHALFRQAVIF